MLNFDVTHKSINENINIRKGKKVKGIIVAGLIASNVLTFSGCAKTVPCDISGNHAHYYVNDDYLGRYIVSEKSKVSGLTRTDAYIPVTQEDEELLKFLNKKGLYRIDDNKTILDDIAASQNDYLEYRYSYYYLMPIPITHTNGKQTYTTFTYVPMTGYSWTTDQSKNLTGQERLCHYVYYGYKVVKNEKGIYEIIQSDPVDNLEDLPEGYDYVKEKFYDVVNYYDRNQILDYEDGPEEDKKAISEEEYNNQSDEKSI